LATTAFCVGFAGAVSAAGVSAGSTTSIWAVSPGASPRGFETVAPEGVEGARVAVPCASPRGFETVAPWEAAETVFAAELLDAAAVAVEAEPNGFATVAPVVGAALAVDGDVDAVPAGGNPRGFATLAP
jgi:hypothetical protein